VEVAAEDKIVCHRVQGMGELTTHTVCEKQSEVNLRNQEALQEAAQRNQANHMHGVPGSGS
jgi:DNA-binding helix-hairpin-helix protein with protein kinase domain